MNLATEISSKVILLKGLPLVSDFRLERILTSVQEVENNIADIYCDQVYFLNLNKNFHSLSSKEIKALKLILKPHLNQDFSQNNSFIILPRKGTISPWSSKAEDIVRNCGLSFIDKIERGICYTLFSKDNLSNQQLQRIGSSLADRMTEEVVTDFDVTLIKTNAKQQRKEVSGTENELDMCWMKSSSLKKSLQEIYPKSRSEQIINKYLKWEKRWKRRKYLNTKIPLLGRFRFRN